ncbi:MAG: hypothetical protein K2N73_11095 [Lachnospiraceae bacterium]|nr:hypothetical protein [Lachnospiraceae bacterium]
MKNNQLFPFERNRYYAGKLLTSADFEAEQLYMNNKRRFLNRVLFGSGIVCGLNVVNLDDLSILVESGVAIDGAGREIVVESTVIKKISGMEGFDTLNGDAAGLYIRYREENIHDVYCGDIGTDGREYESNRIDEGYELYLKDEEKSFEKNSAFLLWETLMDNADYSVYISIPYTVPKGHMVKLAMTICKNSDTAKELSLHITLQMPAFTDAKGSHELRIDIDRLSLFKGQSEGREYWIFAEYSTAEETSILCRKEDICFQVGDYEIEPAKGLNMKLLLSEQQPYELAASEVGKVSLDTDMREELVEDVCIATLKLLRTDTSCLISGAAQQEARHYIVTPKKTDQRQLLMSYFMRDSRVEHQPVPFIQEMQTGTEPENVPMQMAGGRIEIPLDVRMKKGDVCLSDEIMHGLGKGNVYVEVGMEYLDDMPHGTNNRRNTIYGNPELFNIYDCMQVETAVRVLNDKGSFQVAAKLLGEQKSIVLQLNWVAVKFSPSKDSDEIQEGKNCSITPDMPTVHLNPKESFYFNISFQNLLPCRLSYELTEPCSGEISADGTYTAPAKEGVYEIYIYCTDMPKISTYAYAVVSKNKAEERQTI